MSLLTEKALSAGRDVTNEPSGSRRRGGGRRGLPADFIQSPIAKAGNAKSRYFS